MFNKEFIKIALAVLIALLVYDLVVKKFILKSSFEDNIDDDTE